MDPLQAAQIMAVLQALGLYNYDFSGMSKKDITDYYKTYDKYIEPTFEEQYDRISPRYPIGSAMGQALRLMREERLAPESVIGILLDNEIEVTPEMEKDLDEYYDFLQKNEISQAERVYELGREGRALGLTASPEEGFEVPVDVVAGLFRLQDGKSISGEARRAADVAQRAYERYLAAKERGETPGSFMQAIQGELAGPALSAGKSGGIVVNGKRYNSREEYEQEINRMNTMLQYQNANSEVVDPSVLAQREEYESSIFGPTGSSASMVFDPNALPTGRQKSGLEPMPESNAKKVQDVITRSQPKQPVKPKFDYRASMTAAYKQTADLEAAKDAAVAAVLRNRLESTFGSPYQQQVLGIDAQMARILAAEAAARAERERKRRGY